MQLSGMEPLGGTSDEFARRIKADTAQWDAVIAASGLGK
jgi:tripartite-type tricarboxylate transporter receptor subunit TctC